MDSLPMDAAKTAPKPIANGPPIFKNFSLGAHTATVDKPPTIPAVYLKTHTKYLLKKYRRKSVIIKEFTLLHEEVMDHLGNTSVQ